MRINGEAYRTIVQYNTVYINFQNFIKYQKS